jgi:S-adenosylmethionine synthetase
LSIYCNSYGTAKQFGNTDGELTEIVKQNFDLRPGCIVRDLKLKQPIFQSTAAYGHFGRENAGFKWEVVKDLRPAAALDVLPPVSSNGKRLRIE